MIPASSHKIFLWKPVIGIRSRRARCRDTSFALRRTYCTYLPFIFLSCTPWAQDNLFPLPPSKGIPFITLSCFQKLLLHRSLFKTRRPFPLKMPVRSTQLTKPGQALLLFTLLNETRLASIRSTQRKDRSATSEYPFSGSCAVIANNFLFF